MSFGRRIKLKFISRTRVSWLPGGAHNQVIWARKALGDSYMAKIKDVPMNSIKIARKVFVGRLTKIQKNETSKHIERT